MNEPKIKKNIQEIQPIAPYPSFTLRLYAVWYRHVRVYTKHLYSNGTPPFFEPLIFLAGIGLGLNKYIHIINGIEYLQFLATGLVVSTAMFTATFECTFGTFIRLVYDKVYDGMLAASITVNDLLIGEIIWAGTKGLFFSSAVLIVMALFGIITNPLSLLSPLVGFLTGLMFSVLAMIITSYVKTINHFNFYFTGFISPMFFFSGTVFPTNELPAIALPIVEALPLTHAVRLSRGICLGNINPTIMVFDLMYAVFFIMLGGFCAIKLLKKRLIE
ncbi:MAG: ABC transporter permease [Candidatus Magnetoovum sp. WYHC-5]|nr:ABC transporter permease [Candidatus Magnetoovum sp. WYHC-5]